MLDNREAVTCDSLGRKSEVGKQSRTESRNATAGTTLTIDFPFKYEFRVEFNFMQSQHFKIFFLECLFLVMLPLITNVPLDTFNHRLTDGKSSVTSLPLKFARRFLSFVEPLGRICLEQLNGF